MTEEIKQPGESTSSALFRKALIIFVIGIILLIPLLMMENLANERERESENVQNEITSKWGGIQSITTPLLALLYTANEDTTQKSVVYILPREVKATANLDLEMRHRSIYQVPVYTSEVTMNGQWNTEDIRQVMKDKPGRYDLSKAKVAFAVSDAKGFRDLVHINVNGKTLRMKSDSKLNIGTWFEDISEAGYTVDDNTYAFTNNVQSAFYPISLTETDSIVPFECTLTLLGSKRFGFLTSGTTSSIDIKGNWGNPSFQGKSLPIHSNVTDKDFDAQWKTVYGDSFVEQENFPLLGANNAYIDFVNPADHYTKTDRSIKYGFLIIALTLLSIFLIELTLHKRGKSINPLHYLLTGLSLVLFYSLLLSFSEVIGFGWSYLLACIMTVVLNALYFRSILREKNTALLLGGILAFLYLSVYVLLQMKTYALVVGSLWLFAILAFIMFYSARIMRKE